MYETVVDFLKMVDDEERKANPVTDRAGYFLKKAELRDKDGFRVYRIGQAFMNALRGSEYYDKLTGSRYDVFYKDKASQVIEAIDFLCRKGVWE